MNERRIKTMTVKNQELYNVIEKLPEELSVKVLDYIEYLMFSNANNNAPEELMVKSIEDLREKLEEGRKDFECGNVCSLEEAYLEVQYKIQLSIKAKNDYKKIINYLKNELLEPSIANRYAELINSEIQSLEHMPQKYAIIDDDIAKKLEIRKLLIKNYIAFYRINEKEKIVEVHRILYGASVYLRVIIFIYYYSYFDMQVFFNY